MSIGRLGSGLDSLHWSRVAITRQLQSAAEEGGSIWLRLRVYNTSLSVAASNVTCTIMSVHDFADGAFRPLLVGRTIKWSNVEPRSVGGAGAT
jgi:hypothetical protein